MNKKYFIFLLLILLSACASTDVEPKEWYDKYRKSVVLIRNNYYFEIHLSDDKSMYYTVEGESLTFYFDEEEAQRSANQSDGTGFFISSEGEIATNRHIVVPDKRMSLLKTYWESYVETVSKEINEEITKLKLEQLKLIELPKTYFEYIDEEVDRMIRSEISRIELEIKRLVQFLEEMDNEELNVEVKLSFIGVAYDGSFIENQHDFNPCIVRIISKNKTVDLAIIQLESQSTPHFVENMFQVDTKNEKTSLAINEDVYMIGFNAGEYLAKTSKGLKSQFTHGTITQQPDHQKILYSIPTLPGSSGSPVFNKKGVLVAVNYAKMEDYQGFSLGIPQNKLTILCSSKSIRENTAVLPQKIKPKASKSKRRELIDKHVSVILEFLKAEDKRKFSEISPLFSTKVIRYYDLKYPTQKDLKKRYEKQWQQTTYSKNKILSIEKIEETDYIVNTEYSFLEHDKKEEKKVIEKVSFGFDDQGKIAQMFTTEEKINK